MCRCDFESINILDQTESIKQNFIQCLNNCNVVVFSDYDKGLLKNISELIFLARNRNKFVIVDPKSHDFYKYQNCNIITPNCKELEAVIGKWYSEVDLTQKVSLLRQNLNIDYVLLTRSEAGMTIFGNNLKKDFPAQAREVFDVSGAGDTVVAVLSFLIASGSSLINAINIANKAAGIVVGKVGTSPISKIEFENIPTVNC